MAWSQVESLLACHQKRSDATPNQALNRLFREYVPKAPVLEESNCETLEQTWTLAQLRQLRRRHDRALSRSESGPIVVVEYRSEHYLIDGNNRVNKWLRSVDRDKFAVLLVRLSSDAAAGTGAR